MAGRRSTAWPLAALYAGLVVYASLYPFTGWRWPPGGQWADLLWLPWPRWRDRFDEVSNLLGYAPLGALLCVAVLRSGGGLLKAVLAGLLLPALLSLALELAQGFVPARVPSGRDWMLNALGSLAGVVLAAGAQLTGWVDRWGQWRTRWFLPQANGGLVLLLLWPVGLLFPAPVALGLGQVFGWLRDLAETVLQDSFLDALLDGAAAPVARTPLPSLTEASAIALGLLAPCLVAFASMRPGWRRGVAVAVVSVVAVVASTLSTALNFGPAHALTWATPAVWLGLAAGALTAGLLSFLRGPGVLAAGLVVITAGVLLAARAPQDPYFAASLKLWEQGQFIRFHGLAQWIGWVWPYAAAGWLLHRLGAPRQGGS
jgi:VanZ family protein